MRQLTAGSLFSGIGGIDLAFALAGFKILFQVEIDTFCQKVLAKHGPTYWPDATIHADVCNVGRHNLPTVDVLFGGFPCQSVSNAGKREGIHSGSKSGLWFEFERIISELRPRVVFLENVAAITGRDGVKTINGLTQMGYDCRWGIVSAEDAGAPHKRDRWFCMGYSNSIGYIQPSTTIEFRDHQKWNDTADQQARGHKLYASLGNGEVEYANSEQREQREVATSRSKAGLVGGRPGAIGVTSTGYVYESELGRTVDGISSRMDGHQLMAHKWPMPMQPEQYPHEAPRMAPKDEYTIDRIRALGNAVVPQCIYPIAVQIAQLLRHLR